MTIISSLLTITILVIINAVFYGWVKSKHTSGVDRDAFMFPMVLGSLLFGVTELVNGLMFAFKILGVLSFIALFIFVLVKLATFFSNYSARKFSEKE